MKQQMKKFHFDSMENHEYSKSLIELYGYFACKKEIKGLPDSKQRDLDWILFELNEIHQRSLKCESALIRQSNFIDSQSRVIKRLLKVIETIKTKDQESEKIKEKAKNYFKEYK